MNLPLTLLLLASTDLFYEKIHTSWGQWFAIDEVLYEEKTPYFEQMIFQNDRLGAVHVLDGVIQSTEKDEFVYQEMIAHVPLIAHGNPKSVLIIGGGDGGVLREVLKHPTIESAHLVEIDEEVVKFSKLHLPHLSKGSFDHPKSKIHIQDGALFVKECQDRFDVIIIDSTDPIGPCAVLFTSEFFHDCKNLLNKDGILVNMSDVPFLQQETLQLTHQNLLPHFEDVTFFLAAAPTYVGGFIALAFASDNATLKDLPLETLTSRFTTLQGPLSYYNPRIHQASFALPTFILNAMK